MRRPTNLTDYEIDELIGKLTKPIYVWRMAGASLGHTNKGQEKSAKTRRSNARHEIREILAKLLS